MTNPNGSNDVVVEILPQTKAESSEFSLEDTELLDERVEMTVLVSG